MTFSEKLKKRIRKQSQMSCCICQKVGVDIHHIVPIEEGGTDTIENAAPLCPSCHEIYGANITKRKFIREARDNWYEICEKKCLSEQALSDEIKELLEQKTLKNDLKNIFQEIKRISEVLNPIGEKSSLAEIMKYIYETDIESNGLSREEVEFLYLMTFGAECGESGWHDELQEFLRLFGTETAWRLCAKKIIDSGIDFSGFTTDEYVNLDLALGLDAALFSHDAEIIKGDGYFETVEVHKGDHMMIRIAMDNCKAITAKGIRCKRRVTRFDGYCWQHII